MRVSSRWAQGCVVLSVDVAEAAGASADAVMDLLARRGLPATLALADPVASPLGSRILSGHPSNELALLVPAAWVHGKGRALVAAELTRHASDMSARGLRLSSLVSHNGVLDVHADLLLKRGITAVRVGTGTAAKAQRPWARWLGSRRASVADEDAARLVRFGLWEFRPQVALPSARRTACRAIERVADRGGACHVAIDAAAVGSLGRSGLAALNAVLAFVEERRAEGTLTVGTLAEAARRLTRPRSAPAAQSILRSRAA